MKILRRSTVLVILAGYAWVTAGVRPFSWDSYVLVALPSVSLVLAYVCLGGLSRRRPDIGAMYRRRAGDATLSSVAPWLVLVFAALLLEVTALILGGRSATVPTLSTAVDHLLDTRWERGVFCLAWFIVGAAPVFRLRHVDELPR